MAPDLASAIADIAARLKVGGWRFCVHADAKDHALWVYVSDVDPRVTLTRQVGRRSGKVVNTFAFADSGVDVELPAWSRGLVTDEGVTFATLEDLAAGIVQHEDALRSERDWRDAEPVGDAP